MSKIGKSLFDHDILPKKEVDELHSVVVNTPRKIGNVRIKDLKEIILAEVSGFSPIGTPDTDEVVSYNGSEPQWKRFSDLFKNVFETSSIGHRVDSTFFGDLRIDNSYEYSALGDGIDIGVFNPINIIGLENQTGTIVKFDTSTENTSDVGLGAFYYIYNNNTAVIELQDPSGAKIMDLQPGNMYVFTYLTSPVEEWALVGTTESGASLSSTGTGQVSPILSGSTLREFRGDAGTDVVTDANDDIRFRVSFPGEVIPNNNVQDFTSGRTLIIPGSYPSTVILTSSTEGDGHFYIFYNDKDTPQEVEDISGSRVKLMKPKTTYCFAYLTSFSSFGDGWIELWNSGEPDDLVFDDTLTVDYNFDSSQLKGNIFMDTSSGNGTVNLPGEGAPTNNGARVTVKNIGTGNNTLTVNAGSVSIFTRTGGSSDSLADGESITYVFHFNTVTGFGKWEDV